MESILLLPLFLKLIEVSTWQKAFNSVPLSESYRCSTSSVHLRHPSLLCVSGPLNIEKVAENKLQMVSYSGSETAISELELQRNKTMEEADLPEQSLQYFSCL